MKQTQVLYRGKAKTVYSTDSDDKVIVEFRDDTSAFNGLKLEQLAEKGAVNNQINAYIMGHLSARGIKTDFIERLSKTTALMKRLTMVPIECVIRNKAAGGLTKRLGVARGEVLSPPIFEFFLKSDALGDPMITRSHIETLKLADPKTLDEMTRITMQVNQELSNLFAEKEMELVDFKLEFGFDAQGQLTLGDEITPDGCRIWDLKTQDILDKDRFRQELGDVVSSYKIIGNRLGITFE